MRSEQGECRVVRAAGSKNSNGTSAAGKVAPSSWTVAELYTGRPPWAVRHDQLAQIRCIYTRRKPSDGA